ncbi:SDR family oxidoreductase [Roseivirga sp. UBA838]|uniref:SDR family oxidoreductase n=1 Tax=Roseivirga sp. UBA838 TaxID=1947393 RepID=UPI00257BAC1A|nr:SDR family oxidoreductase [Roseivirga sp. UBA838]|tara:strand:- start:24462 stop:25250 length:789 start_codon:yes stop_codon:yes gene_type:complete
MDLNLKGKSALVCGSTQGIGKAIAEELANLGCSVTLCARNKQKLEEVKQGLFKASGQKHQILVADFASPTELKSTIDKHLAEGNQYHILINNTGGPPAGQAIDADVEAFRIAFNQHLVCNQILTQACVPAMKEAAYGRIINVISTSVKMPIPGLGVSNTIRGAVANWSKTLANELGQFGITVNNVLPGATSTQRLTSIIENKAKKTGRAVEDVEAEMKSEIPARRFAEASEVAAAAAFLASPAAGYINGINVPVDGGRTGCL